MTKKTKRKIFASGFGREIDHPGFFDLGLASYVLKHKRKSVYFSKKGRTENFFTNDSKLYLTQEELRLKRRSERIVRIVRRLDSVHARSFEKTKIYDTSEYRKRADFGIEKWYGDFREKALDMANNPMSGLSVGKMWKVSVIGSVIFGMLTMTMVYRYLGQNVSAKIESERESIANAKIERQYSASFSVESEALEAGSSQEKINEEIDLSSITKLFRDPQEVEKENLEKEIRSLVKGYPIEKMVPEIAKKDRKVAAFIIAIAKKESNWGKRIPVYKGQDCYNYWGYRGKNAVATGGHTCFSSPKDAVDTVAKRIEFLVSNEKLNTPNKMVIWKCGYDCSWDNPAAVQKWIDDVDTYFKKLNKKQ